MLSTHRSIELRGVEVHNLKGVNLDIPNRQLVVVCGLSGSGKTSLALDTLYAEGQRRYIETFSAYTRQFFERLEKPAAERISGIPPAVAVTHKNPSRSSRATVGTTTEAYDYLRLLFAKIGQVACLSCGRPVRRETPESTASALAQLPAGARYLLAFTAGNGPAADDRVLKKGTGTSQQTKILDEIGSSLGASPRFQQAANPAADRPAVLAGLREEGFARAIVDQRLLNLNDAPQSADSTTPVDAATTSEVASSDAPSPEILAVVDRLTAGGATPQRLRDSLETAFAKGNGACVVLVEMPERPPLEAGGAGSAYAIDGQPWWRLTFSNTLRCDDCGREYPPLEPRLFSFNSPLGACPECEGFGNVIDIDLDLVVPDPNKSLREGAVAPWNTPAYNHELKELIALADDVGLPLDVPFRELTPVQRQLIVDGVPAHNFGGLRGFFAWLEKRKYKMHLRVFLSRWRSYRPCPVCAGTRLRPEALAAKVGGRNIAEISGMKVRESLEFLCQLTLTDWQRRVGRMMLEQVQTRLGYLDAVGLGYLTLDRTLRTLSGGEAQRVALTSALGSSLVNMLYVLDEPSIGLHPADVGRLTNAMLSLRNRGNSVIVVEHEEGLMRASDQIIEVGPGAGERGGEVVFQGTVAEMEASPHSVTGDYLAGRRGIAGERKRRRPSHGWIRLAGARGNNLQNVTVEFPLGVLALVTGVSGSGKSTLVEDTLYPALRLRKREAAPKPAPYDDVFGDGQIDDVVLVDQSPIGRSPRSNPVTYIKAFDEIRGVFAETLDARTRNFTASHFSFNVAGGRCDTCEGDGYLAVDMQFLADVYMRCPQCNGQRYRPEVLKVQYRGRNIAEVLDLTVREAFSFFRGCGKVQVRLKRLIDVGLDYLRLGQPANTLSGGEAQRLKLAGYLSTAKRSRTLFLLDEPTTGLHFADVTQLLDCFEALLAVGHSLIVVEHNLQLMKAADWIIDLGPGAADEGGRVVTEGTPEYVARQAGSATARFLAEALARELQEQPSS
jgi:excinuclease ABC subunit A